MILQRFWEDALAQASYLIGQVGSKDALVLDPHRDVDFYVRAAKREGLTITAVAETHIHADFVSGSRALAQRTGSTLYVSGEGGAEWQYLFRDEKYVRVLSNGDTIRIANIRLDAVHTPGHTPEHIAFLLTDESASPDPLALFAGDFLFVGDVGRPDLLEKVGGAGSTMESGARQLYESLQGLRVMPDWLLVWPGHGMGSACGKQLGGAPVSTLGYERKTNWALKALPEEQFVSKVLEDQPEPPRYFSTMKRVNKKGLEAWEDHGPTVPMEVTRIRSLDLENNVVLDVRPIDQSGRSFLPHSILVPFQRSFLNWAGTLLPDRSPIYLVAADAGTAACASRALALIGFDQTMGWFEPIALDEWSQQHGFSEFIKRVDLDRLLSAKDEGRLVVDVREAAEFRRGHIPGAFHVPLAKLCSLETLDRNAPIVVHCQAGTRSPIAYSVLRRMGFNNVEDFAAGFQEYRRCGLPMMTLEESV